MNESIHHFELYVINDDASTEALKQELETLLQSHFGSASIQMKNFLNPEHRDEASEQGIFSIPMLVRLQPAPRKKVIGNVCDPQSVMFAIKAMD